MYNEEEMTLEETDRIGFEENESYDSPGSYTDYIVGFTIHFLHRRDHTHIFEQPKGPVGPTTNDFELKYRMLFHKVDEK